MSFKFSTTLCLFFLATNGLFGQNQDLERRINQSVREYGVIESANIIDVRSPIASTILTVAPEGKIVQQGETLVQLDAVKLREDLNQQVVSVAKAKEDWLRCVALLDSLKVEAKTRVKMSELALQVAELGLKRLTAENGEFALRRKEINFEIAIGSQRLSSLQAVEANLKAAIDSGPENVEKLQAISIAVAEAEAKLSLAKARLELFEEHLRGEQLAALKLAVLKAESDRSIGNISMSSKLKNGEATAETAETILAVEQDKLDELKEVVSSCNASAPIDGVVLYPATVSGRGARAASTEIGSPVKRGQLIMRLADTDKLLLNVAVNETRIRRVRVGQSAIIRVDAAADAEFKGKVVQVNTVPVPSNWIDKEIKRYSVKVEIQNPVAFLKIGMAGVAEIDAPELRD